MLEDFNCVSLVNVSIHFLNCKASFITADAICGIGNITWGGVHVCVMSLHVCLCMSPCMCVPLCVCVYMACVSVCASSTCLIKGDVFPAFS